MKIIKPPKLNIGDTVGIVSPSSPVDSRSHFGRSVKMLEKMGFRVVIGSHALKKRDYAAGTAQERAEDINNMFADPKVKAIFASIGGYVAINILPLLDYELITENPKIFCGFSDISLLFNAIFKKTGLITFYNFSIERFHEKSSDFTVKSFMDFFVTDPPNLHFPKKSRWKILRSGKARGRLIGGNLETYKDSLPLLEYAFNPKDESGKYIFYFEEHGTDFEAMDKVLDTLWLAGVLDRFEAIVVGKITDIDYQGESVSKIRPSKDPEYHKLTHARETLNQFFVRKFIHEFKLRVPIVTNVDFGYVRNKFTVPNGAMAEVNLNKEEPVIRLVQSPFRLN